MSKTGSGPFARPHPRLPPLAIILGNMAIDFDKPPEFRFSRAVCTRRTEFHQMPGGYAIDDWNDGEDDDGVPPPGLGTVVFMALAAAVLAFIASTIFS